MVSGIQLDYQLKQGYSSNFNQKMFGRISTRKSEKGTYAYYIPGVLDNIPHFRIFEGRIFIGTAKKVDFDPVMKFCKKFDISSVDKQDEDLLMRTGRQRWQFHAKEKGLRIDWF